MTIRRRFLLLFVLVLGVAVGAWVIWPRHSMITLEQIEKLNEGQTLEEVEAILGGPERNEHGDDAWDAANRPNDHKRWVGPEWGVNVRFDADGKVEGYAVARTNRTVLGTVRRWFGL